MKKIKYSEITPEKIYKRRREFVKTIGLSTGSLVISQNLMGVSSILYLDYIDGTGPLKLLNNFVVHIRTIQLTPEGVMLRY